MVPPSDGIPWYTDPYLLCQPRDVLHLPAPSAATQRSIELRQHLRQQRRDVGMQRCEPGMCGGSVLAAQDQRVPAVRRVQLDQPAGIRGSGTGPAWLQACCQQWGRNGGTAQPGPCAKRFPNTAACSPVLQVGHAEVPCSEAHLQRDDLVVTGAVVLG